jgi:hypothetical protein
MVKDSLPFKERNMPEGTYERVFSKSVNPSELKWHWDEEDRIIEALEKTDWLIQFDNEIPRLIEGEIFIPKGVYHRVIKGSGSLRISVKKLF